MLKVADMPGGYKDAYKYHYRPLSPFWAPINSLMSSLTSPDFQQASLTSWMEIWLSAEYHKTTLDYLHSFLNILNVPHWTTWFLNCQFCTFLETWMSGEYNGGHNKHIGHLDLFTPLLLDWLNISKMLKNITIFFFCIFPFCSMSTKATIINPWTILTPFWLFLFYYPVWVQKHFGGPTFSSSWHLLTPLRYNGDFNRKRGQQF